MAKLEEISKKRKHRKWQINFLQATFLYLGYGLKVVFMLLIMKIEMDRKLYVLLKPQKSLFIYSAEFNQY